MISVIEKTAAHLEEACGSRPLSDSQYKTAMLVGVTGCFMILAILLMALLIAASGLKPWEDER